ncbi:hypothetical protein ACWGI0_05375 [Streptomyces sp. NPDC054802]
MKLPDLTRQLSRPARAAGDRMRRMASWSARRGGIVAHPFLRGVSYGAGTSVVAFVVWWFRARHGG